MTDVRVRPAARADIVATTTFDDLLQDEAVAPTITKEQR